MSSFIELCLNGDRLPEEIDDFVDEWHEEPDGTTLHGFLGMTKAEYNLWVIDPNVLHFILDARHSGRDVTEVIEEFNALPMAARAESSFKALELAHWLREQGLWEQ